MISMATNGCYCPIAPQFEAPPPPCPEAPLIDILTPEANLIDELKTEQGPITDPTADPPCPTIDGLMPDNASTELKPEIADIDDPDADC